MNIYLIDNTIDLNSEGEKKSIPDDTGRTGKLRNILAQIKNNSSQISVNALVQVYTKAPQNDDCGKADFLNLTPPFILFIHTSNGCSKEFLENLFSKNGLESSLIACYSGGDEPDWYENLGTNSFKNIRFFRHIGDDVESKWDIPAFVKAVLDKKENAFDYLVRNPNPHLIARSQILTPFVALHLALQASFDEKGNPKGNPLIFDEECKKCCNIINNGELDGILNKLLGSAPDEGKGNKIKEKYEKLKSTVKDLCQVTDKNNLAGFKDLCGGSTSGNDLIGDFAEDIEKVVEQVEKTSNSK